MPGIDLHCHTTASDGLCAPLELVRRAADLGLDTIAVTDHDTVSAVREAVEAGRNTGVRVVAGAEFSTAQEGTHILGYFIDPDSLALARALESIRRERLERAREMVESLCALGYELTLDEVLAQAAGAVVTRPHIARALVARGYVPEVRNAFSSELIGDGGRAYVAHRRTTPTEAVATIREAGGVAVLAHPGVLYGSKPTDAPESFIRSLTASGLGGIEVHHPDHSPHMKDHLADLADELGLVPTGGSDFHGDGRSGLATCTTTAENFARLETLARAGG